MKLTLAGVALIIASLTFQVQAGDWVDGQGTPIPESSSRGIHNGLGVQLGLTKDPRWQDKAGGVTDGIPPFEPVSVSVGEQVLVLVFMAGVEEDPALGRANVVCTYSLLDPRGQVVMKPNDRECLMKKLPVIEGVAKEGMELVYLTHEIIGLTIEDEDPKGVWTLHVVVKDSSKKASIPLKSTFTVR